MSLAIPIHYLQRASTPEGRGVVKKRTEDGETVLSGQRDKEREQRGTTTTEREDLELSRLRRGAVQIPIRAAENKGKGRALGVLAPLSASSSGGEDACRLNHHLFRRTRRSHRYFARLSPCLVQDCPFRSFSKDRSMKK